MDKRTRATRALVGELEMVIDHLKSPEGPCRHCAPTLRFVTIEVHKIRGGEYDEVKNAE